MLDLADTHNLGYGDQIRARVYAINGNGQSAASRVASGTTMNTLPQRLTMPILEDETSDTITISWIPSQRQGVEYELWGDGNADGIFEKMENTIDHIHTVTKVDNSRSYHFKVRA
jgi:hypothetical protein